MLFNTYKIYEYGQVVVSLTHSQFPFSILILLRESTLYFIKISLHLRQIISSYMRALKKQSTTLLISALFSRFNLLSKQYFHEENHNMLCYRLSFFFQYAIVKLVVQLCGCHQLLLLLRCFHFSKHRYLPNNLTRLH